MAAPKTETQTRTIAQFVGFHGTTRIITKDDQNRLAGVTSGVGKEDLVWPAGNSKLDVTDVPADTLEYLKGDEEFKLSTVEVTPEA